jgi:hypothetical protein
MRGRLMALTVAALTLSTTGCLSGFKYPLGPVSEGFIDKALLGAWVCHSADDTVSTDLTFVDFDGWQYLVQSDDHKSSPCSHRAIGTRLDDGATFVSLRALAPNAEEDWSVLTYSFSDANHFSLGLVDPDPFEDIIDDRQAVRERLAAHLQDSEVLHELLSCTQRDARAAQPQS